MAVDTLILSRRATQETYGTKQRYGSCNLGAYDEQWTELSTSDIDPLFLRLQAQREIQLGACMQSDKLCWFDWMIDSRIHIPTAKSYYKERGGGIYTQEVAALRSFLISTNAENGDMS
jgi:hypothetical protein